MTTLKEQLSSFIDKYNNRWLPTLTRDKEKLTELIAFIESHSGEDIKEKAYVALNGININLCSNCSLKTTKFTNFNDGYSKFCCYNCELKTKNRQAAIDRLTNFANNNFEYISGYDGSHSTVFVKNKNCGCTFGVTYLNLFTNKNYCPTHGSSIRKEKLQKRNSLGLTNESKAKRKASFERKADVIILNVLKQNQDIENALLESPEELSQFLIDVFANHSPGHEHILQKFTKIHSLISSNYGSSFGNKMFNYLSDIKLEDDVPKCPVCLNPASVKQNFNYFEHCSMPCAKLNPTVVEKQKQTSFKNYGGKWFTQTEDWSTKTKATNLERYGVENPLQNKEIQTKVWRSQYRLKPTSLPSGKVIDLMGYEPQVLEYLLCERYDESDFNFDCIPTFKYGSSWYFPDFFVESENLIIEVKSEWTYRTAIEATKLKRQSVIDAGFNYELIVWDEKRSFPLTENEVKNIQSYENLCYNELSLIH